MALTGVPLLASTAAEPDGPAVDGIASDRAEHVAFHAHAHLQVYVEGQRRDIPGGIGIVPPYTVQQSTDGPSSLMGRRSTGSTPTTGPA
jgi:hypothetical protein